jgi:hypothetical protein
MGENCMAKPKNVIIQDIVRIFENTDYNDCYIGITSEIESQLFSKHGHNVSRETDCWIYRNSESNGVACEIK